ncbi:hypothetical protein Pmar_PMAR020959 [Perkinsus marinus ATCC 50983]|uniref:Uncharacterized protein n=1 Tax=Perkinsus marinus (strain ATCC 50983 / TXsc) TaxID=423536 RepID=C5KKY1_PERM5|nr:hypothetical protein Pmar_PMAR020959 [Perkinsus marinus ATCC 50983]EER14864.1 hypothetical protein Pmar_PMAR020959 [Perkinsus marinus ATCC 50983]|eukprot:XP_002783068.1 hypothetical protein Pmar_PMAR020959 [Perkinsus marinus ATCC 50983]
MHFSIGKDTVDCYGADIRHNTVLAFKDLDSQSHEKVAATFYWNSLPQTQAVKQSMWSALAPKERTLPKAIDLTRPLFEVEDAGASTQAQGQEELGAVASVPAKGQYSYGGKKGGKGSKGWSSNWSPSKGTNYGKGKGNTKGRGKAMRSSPYTSRIIRGSVAGQINSNVMCAEAMAIGPMYARPGRLQMTGKSPIK